MCSDITAVSVLVVCIIVVSCQKKPTVHLLADAKRDAESNGTRRYQVPFTVARSTP